MFLIYTMFQPMWSSSGVQKWHTQAFHQWQVYRIIEKTGGQTEGTFQCSINGTLSSGKFISQSTIDIQRFKL